MAIDVEELVIQPFREVVGRGKDAVANAEACDRGGEDADAAKLMLRSARALEREGQRALQRLMPLWKAQVDRHGEAFTETIRQNEEILGSQRRLEDLLYDLDDFVDLDTFDRERFVQVQAASKAFALTLLETVKRLRIKDVSPATSMFSVSLASPASQWPQYGPSRPSGGGCAYPESVSTNSKRPSSPDILGAEREYISLVPDDDPSHGMPSSPVPASRISAWVKDQTTASGFWPTNNPNPRIQEQTSAMSFWPMNNTIREYDPFERHTVIDNNLDSLALQDPMAPKPSSVPYSPATVASRGSWGTSTGSYVSGRRSSSNVATSDQKTTSLARPVLDVPDNSKELPLLPSQSAPELGYAPKHASAPVFEDGLIPIDELLVRHVSISNGYQIGLDSSLYLQKGFCPGAQCFRTKSHRSATKAVVEYGTSSRSIARCVECEFGQSLSEVESDMAQDSSGNLCKAGVLYRLRFLYKSHLAADSAFTSQFGCLFCAQKGHTVHADDATVFTTQDQLFQHLSRHTQPLPEIPGVAVLYGNVPKDDPQLGDYDLHFPDSPIASSLPNATLLDRLPAAVAVKSHVKRFGRELEGPEGAENYVLKFLQGGRIVGIQFPELWQGKWCTGWHDSEWGVFPVKTIVPEAPAHLPGSNTGADGMVVTTRWKWDVKDTAAGWLSFDKDETLYNVRWLNQDDWCWSATKKNGKVGGLFPRSHIKPDSLRPESVEPQEVEDDTLPKKAKKHTFSLPTVKMRRLTAGSSIQ